MPLQDHRWSLHSSSQVTNRSHKEPKSWDYRKDKDAQIMHIWNSSYTAKSQTNNTLSTLLAYQCFFQLEHSNKTAEYRKVSLAMEKGSRTHPLSDMHWENHHLVKKQIIILIKTKCGMNSILKRWCMSTQTCSVGDMTGFFPSCSLEQPGPPSLPPQLGPANYSETNLCAWKATKP